MNTGDSSDDEILNADKRAIMYEGRKVESIIAHRQKFKEGGLNYSLSFFINNRKTIGYKDINKIIPLKS